MPDCQSRQAAYKRYSENSFFINRFVSAVPAFASKIILDSVRRYFSQGKAEIF